MGKTKQMKVKKFDRNVEISAPILDPDVIKQIHSPPRDQRLDIKHGGFKALLSDLNSQDSTDEIAPIMEADHLPSYIGISCAVSGYSNYSSYNRKPLDNEVKIESTKQAKVTSSNRYPKFSAPTRSQTSSPTSGIDVNQINHITIDRSHIESADQERRELTEKMTASTSERRRSPSPLAPPEDERHHGAYVGARYFPMPPPSKLVHKHIPLLGIDDDLDPDEVVIEDINKVEEKIATLYGDEFVGDWKESMSHKSKKEHLSMENEKGAGVSKSPKDLVSLKPAPPKAIEPARVELVDVPIPNAKVLANVDNVFLNKLLTDENPPMPKSPSPQPVTRNSKLTQVGNEENNASILVADRKAETIVDSPPGVYRESPVTPVSQRELMKNSESGENFVAQTSPSPVSPEPLLQATAVSDFSDVEMKANNASVLPVDRKAEETVDSPKSDRSDSSTEAEEPSTAAANRESSVSPVSQKELMENSELGESFVAQTSISPISPEPLLQATAVSDFSNVGSGANDASVSPTDKQTEETVDSPKSDRSDSSTEAEESSTAAANRESPVSPVSQKGLMANSESGENFIAQTSISPVSPELLLHETTITQPLETGNMPQSDNVPTESFNVEISLNEDSNQSADERLYSGHQIQEPF